MKKSIYILFFCMLLYGITNAQCKVDSLLPTEVQHFLMKYDCMPINDFAQIGEMKNLVDTYKKLNPINEIRNQLNLPSTYLGYESYFLVGDTATLTNYPAQFYHSLNVSSQLSLKGVPINARANLIMMDHQLDRRLSSFSFQFDHHRYLNQLMEDHLPISDLSDLGDMQLNPLKLNKIEQEVLSREVQLNLYRQILAHPKFKQFKQEQERKLDSLKQLVLIQVNDVLKKTPLSTNDSILLAKEFHQLTNDPLLYQQQTEDYKLSDKDWRNVKLELCNRMLVHPKKQTLQEDSFNKMDSLSKALSPIVLSPVNRNALKDVHSLLDEPYLIEKEYEALWEEKKKENFKVWRGIATKAKQLEDQLIKYQNPNYIKQQVLQSDTTQKLQRLLLLTKDFKIGRFALNESELVARHLSLNGIQYIYEKEGVSAQIAYGNQNIGAGFSPTLGTAFIDRFFGRNFLLLQAGIGSQEKYHVGISFLQGRDNRRQVDSSIVFPQFNRVIGIDGSTAISKELDIIVEAAYSDNDIANSRNGAGDFETNNQINRIATKAGLRYQLPNLGVTLAYFYTGNQYVAMGNPFLLTGRRGISTDIHANLFDGRLFARSSIKYGHSVDEINDFVEWQMTGELSYQFGEQNSITATFMPNLFDQSIYDYQVNVTSNIYTLQTSIYKEIAGVSSNTLLHLTNLRTDFQYVDTLEVNDAAYFYLQELWYLGDKSSLNSTCMIGSESITDMNIKDFIYQLDYSFSAGKHSFTGGGQILKQQQFGLWQYGFKTNLNIHLWRQAIARIHLIYRNFLEKTTLNGSQILGNVSFQYAL